MCCQSHNAGQADQAHMASPDHETGCLHQSRHVCQLELGVLESTKGLAKLLSRGDILLGNVQAELSTAKAARSNVDPAPIYCRAH